MSERWKTTQLSPNYDVSTLGRVRVWKLMNNPLLFGEAPQWKPVLLKPYKSIKGYLHLSIVTAGPRKIRRDMLVHRLVATAFIRNPHDYPQVNHKNLIKHDNRVENLEWVSPRQNLMHAIRAHGGFHWAHGAQHTSAKLTDADVLRLRRLHAEGRLNRATEARKLGVSARCICKVVNRKSWKHIGDNFHVSHGGLCAA